MAFSKHDSTQNFKSENSGCPKKFNFRKSDLSTPGCSGLVGLSSSHGEVSVLWSLIQTLQLSKIKGKSIIFDYSLNNPEVLKAKTMQFLLLSTPLHARHMDLTGSWYLHQMIRLVLPVVFSLSSDEHLHLVLPCTTMPSPWDSSTFCPCPLTSEEPSAGNVLRQEAPLRHHQQHGVLFGTWRRYYIILPATTFFILCIFSWDKPTYIKFLMFFLL